MSNPGLPFTGTTSVNLAPQQLPYQLQLAQIQRQQALADQLGQENDKPIPVMTGGGQPAPISWGSVLGKALGDVSGAMRQNYANNQLQQLGQQDAASKAALMRAI